MEDNQPDEKVTAEEETTPPKTLLERCEKASQECCKMEEEAKMKAVLEKYEHSSQQCLKMALKQEEARKVLEKKVVKARKSTIEKKVETLEKKVAKHDKTVAKHDKVLKELEELTATLSSQMTKIGLSRRLQQEVEDLKNENRELKLKLAKRNKEVEVKLVEGSIDMTSVDLDQVMDKILLETKANTDKLFASHLQNRARGK